MEDERETTIGALDVETSVYVHELVRRARGVLPDLVSSYLIGSGALGDYVPGSSDVDVNVVVAGPLPLELKEELVQQVVHDVLPCPAAKLELVVCRVEVLKQPSTVHEYELNLNTGSGVTDLVFFDFRNDDPHWFVLDAAIARERGMTITGPDISTLIAEIPRDQILEALRGSIEWHRAHETTYLTVLNACRSWHYAVEGTWVSKTQAARWARTRSSHGDLIEVALQARAAGRAGHAGSATTGGFLDEVMAALG